MFHGGLSDILRGVYFAPPLDPIRQPRN